MEYRIWDKVENKFVDNIMVCSNGKLERKFDGACSRNLPSLERYTISRCSEITDKNANKIYEGDFVKFRSEVLGDGEEFSDRVGLVLFQECTFWINYSDEALRLWSETRNYEILGNIFENSELLEEEHRKRTDVKEVSK